MRSFSKPSARSPSIFEPFWQSPGGAARIWQGNVTDVLARLPARSVQCCVTSPPYWGLRSYSVCPACKKHSSAARCEECGHVNPDFDAEKACEIGSEPSPDCGTQGKAQCGKCFVCNMVAVFRGVRRALRDDGVLWLNLGDSYASGEVGRNDDDARNLERRSLQFGTGRLKDGRPHDRETKKMNVGLPSGNLVGVPWRVALALQANGWVLRSDVPWVKRSPLPEPVTNRPAKSLEYVFLLTKGMDYYFDMGAVRKEAARPDDVQTFGKRLVVQGSFAPDDPQFRNGKEQWGRTVQTGGNGRAFRQTDLWYQSAEPPWGMVGAGDELVGLDVTSQGYPGAHFATFSPRLVEPLILAGTSACGACAACGAPWERVAKSARAEVRVSGGGNCIGKQGHPAGGTGAQQEGNYRQVLATNTLGWRPRCGCRAGIVPCVVFDPFLGSGTTIAVAIKHGRHGWGIDLSETYIRENAVPRIEEALAGEKAVEACARLPALEAKAPERVEL